MMSFILTLLSLSAWSLCERPQAGMQVGTISHPELLENSGMDFSRNLGGHLWSLNDANNEAKLYSLTHEGKVERIFNVHGAQNVDWEDVSVASCYYDYSKECIYIGDIGNNDANRATLSIYVVEEPKTLLESSLQVKHRIDFATPENQNFEAMAYDEVIKDFLLISKAKKKTQKTIVYSISLLGSVSSLGQLSFENLMREKNDRIVTSMDFDPRSGSMLIGTYGQAYEILRRDLPNSSKLKTILVPGLPKAEAITYGFTNGVPSLWTSSEGQNQPLIQISCQ